MIRFLGLTVFLIIVAGLALHSQMELPGFVDWIGKLPGDLLIKKGDVTIYVPLTTAALLSMALSIILSLFSSSK